MAKCQKSIDLSAALKNAKGSVIVLGMLKENSKTLTNDKVVMKIELLAADCPVLFGQHHVKDDPGAKGSRHKVPHGPLHLIHLEFVLDSLVCINNYQTQNWVERSAGRGRVLYDTALLLFSLPRSNCPGWRNGEGWSPLNWSTFNKQTMTATDQGSKRDRIEWVLRVRATESTTRTRFLPFFLKAVCI